MNNLKPKVRRIGNVLHFRGQVMIPLTDGSGNALQWSLNPATPIDSYFAQTAVTPASSGPGSVLTSTDGLVIFNSNLSVIPTSVVGGSVNLDFTYSKEVRGFRRVQIRSTPGSITSTILTTIGLLSITDQKKLVFTLTKNAEISILSLDDPASANTSPLNYSISHVNSGDYVPNFKTTTNTVTSSTASGATENVVLDYSDTNLTYPFTCNANNETDLGGFFFILDGLTAFVNPCTTDIGTAAVCS